MRAAVLQWGQGHVSLQTTNIPCLCDNVHMLQWGQGHVSLQTPGYVIAAVDYSQASMGAGTRVPANR